MAISENNTPTVAYANHVVNVVKVLPTPPPPLKYNKVSFVALKKPDGDDLPAEGAEYNGTNDNDFTNYIDERDLTQLKNFKGIIKLFNSTDAETIVASASNYGDTIILSSSISDLYLGFVTGGGVVDFKNLYVWLTLADSAIPTTYTTFAAEPYHGVMIDLNDEGKTLYAVTSMVASIGTVAFTNRITNSAFTGITNQTDSASLAEQGLSFWFKSIGKTYADSMQLGGQQAYKMYYDKIIEYDVVSTVAEFVNAGHPFNATTLTLLENRISIALNNFKAIYSDVSSVSVPIFEAISPTNKRLGYLQTVNIGYTVAGELRRIAIEITN